MWREYYKEKCIEIVVYEKITAPHIQCNRLLLNPEISLHFLFFLSTWHVFVPFTFYTQPPFDKHSARSPAFFAWTVISSSRNSGIIVNRPPDLTYRICCIINTWWAEIEIGKRLTLKSISGRRERKNKRIGLPLGDGRLNRNKLVGGVMDPFREKSKNRRRWCKKRRY